jgi:hypothetical protein
MANPGETIEADDLRGGVVRRSVVGANVSVIAIGNFT